MSLSEERGFKTTHTKDGERIKLWNGSVSLSEEESDFKKIHTQDVGQFLLLLEEIQVLSPRACVEEFYVTLRHATSCQTRHYTHTTSRHAASRRPAMQLVTSRNVASRHVRHCTSRYAVWQDAMSHNATLFTSRQSPQPTPLRSAHRVEFRDLHGHQKKTAIIFPFSI